jgi:hypothetical protein
MARLASLNLLMGSPNGNWELATGDWFVAELPMGVFQMS